jgi:large subunit ribosomal protein L24
MNKISLDIKKGDTVKVLSGKEKGKTGKVLEVLPADRKVIVEGMNIHVRFSRPKRQREKGQRLELPAPMIISKLMLICPACGKPTRIAHEVNERGNFRKCKHCHKLV